MKKIRQVAEQGLFCVWELSFDFAQLTLNVNMNYKLSIREYKSVQQKRQAKSILFCNNKVATDNSKSNQVDKATTPGLK